MQISQPAKNVLLIDMDVSVGWEQWFLLSSDRHRDNKLCDTTLEGKHLELAKQRNAKILDFGDMHCAMQGKWDKRADQDQMLTSLRGNNYLNKLTKVIYNAYKEYKNQFLFISPGNHETSVIKRHQYDLTEAFVDKMNEDYPTDKPKLFSGSYAGWIKFRFRSKTGNRFSPLTAYYNHGYGGGGPVTKGIIQTNRMVAYLANADFVFSGHTHDQWIFPVTRAHLNESNVPDLKEQWHIKCGGYKEEFLCGQGFHAETGKPPKPLGAVWLRLFIAPGDISKSIVSSELILAK